MTNQTTSDSAIGPHSDVENDPWNASVFLSVNTPDVSRNSFFPFPIRRHVVHPMFRGRNSVSPPSVYVVRPIGFARLPRIIGCDSRKIPAAQVFGINRPLKTTKPN